MSTRKLTAVTGFLSGILVGYLGYVDGHTVYYDHNPTVRTYAISNFVITFVAVFGAWGLGFHTALIGKMRSEIIDQIFKSQDRLIEQVGAQYSIQSRLLDLVAQSGRGDLIKKALDVIFEGEPDGAKAAEDAAQGEPAHGGDDRRAKGSHARGSRRRQGPSEDSPVSGDVLPRSRPTLRDGSTDAD